MSRKRGYFDGSRHMVGDVHELTVEASKKAHNMEGSTGVV